MSEEYNSITEAGGCAVGMTGKLECFNGSTEDKFANALVTVGEWVAEESGALLGHIKAAITLDDGSGMTLNLTSLQSGVERHGSLRSEGKVNFTFMCAVLDVDEAELKHRMFHAIDDSGMKYELDEHVECHCHEHHHHHDHEHGEGCTCGCHDHEHHHHHDHEHGECHCHDHDHSHCDHDHGHGHDHEEGHCPACEAKKGTGQKKSLLDRLRRKKE